MTTPTPDDVYAFWLGELDEHGCATSEMSQRWWRKSDEFDSECAARFAGVHEAICQGALEGWLETPRGRVAYVIVVDQLSRNIYRGSPSMYAADARASKASLDAVAAGIDQELGYHERYFLYMPLMHAEDAELQERCVQLFSSLADAFPGRRENVAQAVGYAERHRDIVVRFGRFPHRNEILGRESTPEEVAFLKEPGSSF